MIFPKISFQYATGDDSGVLRYMQDFYQEAIAPNQVWWSQAEIDTKFEAGDQSIWDSYYGDQWYPNRKKFSFNRLRRIKNMISGHQYKNRKSLAVNPQENGDAETADQFTKVLQWILQKDNVLDTISDAFEESLVTGMSLLQVCVDYRNDPLSGDIKVDNCAYNTFMIDPYFRKADLSDCNGIWRRTYVTKQVAKSLLPNMKSEIDKIPLTKNNRDGLFPLMPENFSYNTANLVAYDEFYYKDSRTQTKLIDTQTYEEREWDGPEENLQEYLKFFPQMTVFKQEIPTTKLAIVLNGTVMFHDYNPMNIDEYPFVPVMCYYAPQMPDLALRIQGVIRGARDAQYLYNRRKVIELDILESQINSGFIYKPDSMVNPKDIFLSGQGKGLPLKKNAQMTDVQKIESASVNPSLIQLSELLAREIQEITGVSEEAVGAAAEDRAGIVEMMRQTASVSTLMPLFRRLDRSQKLLGQLIINLIQSNFLPAKVQRIIEDQPAPQFYNKAFGKYDAVIVDSFDTATQKQLQFAQLLQLRQLNINIPDSVLIESATVQNKKQLIEAIQQESQAQQQMQQAQMELQMQQLQSQAQLNQAKSGAYSGLEDERKSRVAENVASAGERRAEAAKDRQLALLNMTKALKQLEEADIRNLTQLIQLAKMVGPVADNVSTTERSMSEVNNRRQNVDTL